RQDVMQTLSDFRYSLRLLRKAPEFTAITLLVIVLGLSLFITSYTFTTMTSDEPMPFPNGDRFVSLRGVDPQNNGIIQGHDVFSYDRLLERSESYSVLGGYSRSTFVFSDGTDSRRFSGASITPDLFAATATSPILGRSLTTDDVLLNGDRVALISYTLWQDYYGGAADIAGRTSQVNGQPVTIVGVMPEGFHFPRSTDLWVPLAVPTNELPGQGLISMIGVLKEFVTRSEAQAEAVSIMEQLAVEYPEYYDNRSELVSYYSTIYLGDFTLPLAVSFITWIVLALAVVNLSSLLYMRSNSRQQELVIRSSVGASGWELVKQVLMESFVICAFGLMLSCIATVILLQVLEFAWGPNRPYWYDFELNMDAVSIGIVVTLLIWLVSGLATSYKVYRSQPGEILDPANRGGGIQQKKVGATNLVVGIEVILSCFLLIFCGATVSMFKLSADTDYGVTSANRMVGAFSLSHSDYESEQSRISHIENLTTSIAEFPEVTLSAITTALPHRSGLPGRYEIEELDFANENQSPRQTTIWVSDNYFRAMDVSLLEGREFDTGDVSSSENVVILTENFARQLWPDSSAIGKRIRSMTDESDQWLTVVGVITPILQTEYDFAVTPSLYRPLTQETPTTFFLVASHQGGLTASGFEQAAKAAAAGVDRNVPLEDIRSLEQQIALDLGGAGGFAVMFVEFTLATLILSGIGIYAVISRSIQLRTHEIGVRRALGSTDFKIIRRFLRQGFYFLLIGIAIGGAPALLMAVTALSFLDNIGDLAIASLPTVSLLVIAIVTFLIATASYLPSRKAILLEPGDALHYE
ncbi:MAG: ABC transporter permease, partial [Pseudomonadales bacterium]|nr:ABC transporter permease [Pseudomonadales bacterium]